MFDIFKAIQGKVKEHHGKFPAKDSCVAFYDGKVINIRGSLDDFKRAYDRILKGTCSDADIQKVHTLFHEFEHMFCFENGIHQEFQLFGTGNHNNVISEICNEIRARARFKSMFPEMELFLDKGNGAYVRRCYDFERLITRFGIDYDKLCSDMLTLKGHYVSDLAKLLTKHSTKGLKVEWFEEFLKNYFACGEDFDKRFGTVLKGRDYAEKMLRQAKLIKRGEVATPPPDQWFLDWANPRVGYRPFEQLKKKHADLIAKGTGGLERTAKAADAIHLARLDSVGRQVDKVYRDAAREASRIGALVGGLSPDKPFSFDDFPNVRKRAEEMLQQFRDGLEGVIVNGIRSEWTLANNKNDEISRMVFGTQVGKLSQEQYRRYFSTNGEARDAFIARRDAGMNLSDRVWNLQSQFKCEMETVLDIGIRNGLSAEEMQRDLQQYLKNPDNYFRRFRYKEGVDENGKPIYKRKWKKRYWDEMTGSYKWKDVDLADYSYGRGVYRSSYKNARRLAVTETNIAYRTADHLRWQEFDFVVGIRIEPSGTNHPVPDICDELAGDYPKDFKWTGWHPHCRCHATSILKTEEEIMRDNERILNGEEPLPESENTVTKLPENFKQWMSENEPKLQRAKSLPYFMTDNPRYTGLTPRMAGANGFTGTKLGRSATKNAYNTYADTPPISLTSDQSTDIKALAHELGIRVTPMTFEEANSGNTNPDFKPFSATGLNCQSCVAVFEARRRGLNLEALPFDPKNTLQDALGDNTASVWRRADGREVRITNITGSNDDELIRKLEKQMKTQGRYHIGVNFKEGAESDDHIFTAETFSDGRIYYYDPQKNEFLNIQELHDVLSFELLKVDKLLFNHNVLKAIARVLDF